MHIHVSAYLFYLFLFHIYTAKKIAKEKRKEFRKREKRFQLFTSMLEEGFQVYMMSRKYGERILRSFDADSDFEKLQWRTSPFTQSHLLFRDIFKVEKKHAKKYNTLPDNISLCFSIHTHKRVIDLEATSFAQYEILVSGFLSAVYKLNRDAAYYMDHDGCIRRVSKSVFVPLTDLRLNAAELSRYAAALEALKAVVPDGKFEAVEEELMEEVERRESLDDEEEEGGEGEGKEELGEEERRRRKFEKVTLGEWHHEKKKEEEEEDDDDSDEEDDEEDDDDEDNYDNNDGHDDDDDDDDILICIHMIIRRITSHRL